MVRRHPHVFGDVAVSSAEHVALNWDAIKAAEKGQDAAGSPLAGVPGALPALAYARAGARVAVLDVREQEAERVAAEIVGAGGAALPVRADVTSEDDVAAAIAVGLLATVPLALRRRTPLVSFVLVMAGLQLLIRGQRGFDNDSMTFVVTFFVALYSLGRHAKGIEAWLGAGGLVLTMATFLQGEGDWRRPTWVTSHSPWPSSVPRGPPD